MDVRNANRGFTLIEVILTIVLLGILAGILAPIIASSITAYGDTASRNELTARGRLALERLAREVRLAVPNSLRIVTSGGNPGIEFVTSKYGGRYLDNSDPFSNSAYSERFKANANLSSLDLLGTSYTNWVNTDFLVIGNYSPTSLQAGTTTAPLTSAPTDEDRDGDGTNEVQNVSFVPAESFSFASPTYQYQIADNTHEVGQNGSAIYWHRSAGISGYDGAGDWTTADAQLVSADSLNLSFSYSNALLRIDMALTEEGETVNLSQEIQVRNTP